jgi:hypothetical protein
VRALDWPSSCEWVLEALRKKGGEDLALRIRQMRGSVAPILSKITETFPEYTIHDVNHSDKICEILGWLLVPSVLVEMTKHEIFFLIAATYFHDIGMADIPEIFDNAEFQKWSAEQDRALSPAQSKEGFIRATHHLRSEKFINSDFLAFGIANPSEAFVIGRITRGHRRLEELYDFDLFPRKFIYANETIDICGLAYFLQLADELDLTFERAPLIVYNSFNPKNPISQTEWEKALSVSGVHLDQSDNRTIIASALCRSERIHRALALLEGIIQRKLDSADQILQQTESSRIPNRIRFQITNVGYEYLDLKFTFDFKTMLPLLGDRIYSRSSDALRELIQNAVDTCHCRSYVCKRCNKEYSPQIVIRTLHSRTGDILEVEDNGLGMDQQVIRSYFGKIGRSFYRSLEFSHEFPDFFSIGEFGVGILSAFMIADRVLIETKADESLPYNIELFPWDEHIFVTKGTRTSLGTKVRLWLKKDFSINAVQEARFYARHIDIPIRIEAENKSTTVNQKWCTYEDFFHEQGYRKTDFPKPFVFKLESHDYRCLVSFPSIEHNVLGRIPLDLTHVAPIEATKLVAVSRQGIFVEYLDLYEFLKKYGIIVSLDLDVSGTATRLLLGRNSVQNDPQFAKLVDDIIDKFTSQLSLLLEGYSKKDKAVFANESLSILSSVFNLFGFRNFPQKLKDFVGRYVEFVAIRKDRIETVPLSKLRDNDEYLICPACVSPAEVAELVGSIETPPKKVAKALDISDRRLILAYGRTGLFEGTAPNLITLGEIISYSVIRVMEMSESAIEGSTATLSDVESFKVKFVSFKNCRTRKFMLMFDPPNVSSGGLLQASYGRLVITQHLLINVDNVFMKALIEVFGRKISNTPIRSILEAVIARDYDAVLARQQEVLEEMKRRGVLDTEKLRFKREDFPHLFFRKD